MGQYIFKIIRYSGLPYLFRKIIQRSRVTLLLFHDIERENADKMFKLLSQLYNIIDLNTFIRAVETKNEGMLPPYSLIITFDDGLRNNFELLPIFKKYKIYPTIFLCAGLVNTSRHFWFRYDQSKQRIAELKKLSNDVRIKLLGETGFKQDFDYDYAQALSKNQIDEMKGEVIFQSHTVFHPCLPQCHLSDAKEEIYQSKTILEKNFNLSIYALAYPNGDYGKREIELCKDAGYKSAVTVDAGYNTVKSNLFKLKRLSVNDTNDVNELIVKASGLWGLLKNIIKSGKSYSD